MNPFKYDILFIYNPYIKPFSNKSNKVHSIKSLFIFLRRFYHEFRIILMHFIRIYFVTGVEDEVKIDYVALQSFI